MKLASAIIVLALGSISPASAQYQSNNNLYGTNSNSGLNGTGSNSNSHTVSPYTNSHGTYVGGSHATNPNNTQLDNYSTKGNVNPYTGAVGTKTPKY